MAIESFEDLFEERLCKVQEKQPAKRTRNVPAKKMTQQASHSMRLQIILRREIEVKCWRVVGQVAKAKKRPELLTVLQRADELKNGTDATDVAKHLLFEHSSRRTVAQRMIDIAEQYDLLEEREKRYFLTELGEDALKAKQVFIPEHGTWTVWGSKDPLLEQPILRVEPWREPSAYDEVRGKEKAASEKRAFEPLPDWIREYEGTPITPLGGGVIGQLILEELEKKGEIVAEVNASLMIEWDVSRGGVRVKGRVDNAEVNSVIPAPDFPPEDAWVSLLHGEGMLERWDSEVSAIRSKLTEAEPSERESMCRDIRFERPRFELFGLFDALVVHGVPLRAQTETDAQDWAAWRLLERIRDYATMSRYSSWVGEAAMPFSEFEIGLPDRDSLAEKRWKENQDRPTSGHWNLVAAKDWGL